MKVLFSKKGSRVYLADKDRLIFGVDDSFFDAFGNEVAFEPGFYNPYDEDAQDEIWEQQQKKNQGLEQPLESESTTEIEWEIDDGFGNFGFKNEAGEFVIEPQYAFAHEFTNGLASVNLNRTWYKTEDGKRYYENHFGYINERGQTIIGFQFDEAYPFNKYGVAVVSDILHGTWLIDTDGNEIPGTHFPHLSHYYNYEDRFLEFSYDDDGDYIGIYDTKERRILIEPSINATFERNENLILVYEYKNAHNISDFQQYYIDSKGEVLFPWLYQKGFAHVCDPDLNNVTAVSVEYTELHGQPCSHFHHDGKKRNRRFIYGLYSSKEEFLLPLEYDDIRNIGGNLWGCMKDGTITIVQTESTD